MSETTTRIDCEVLIVGYGPVGQTMAALLAEAGRDVVVVERYHALYNGPRAGHFDGETMRTFQHLGVSEELEMITRPMVRYELVTPDFEVLDTIPLGEGDQAWLPSYLFYQPELEEVLDRCARAKGARVVTGHSATAVEQDGTGVTVRAEPFEGAGQGKLLGDGDLEVRAQYLIGADGARSLVRDALGITRSDLGFEAVQNLVVDFEHSDPDRDLPLMGGVRQVLDYRRPRLAGRWNGNRWSRWEFMRLPGETIEELQEEDRVWEMIEPWGVHRGEGKIIRRAVHAFEGTTADEWRRGRVLLVGDAAHTMPPFMGQGMCSGIRDAANLNWKLNAVLDGVADDTLLDTYEAERKPHVTQLIEMSMTVGRDVLIIDPEKAAERDQRLRDRRDGVGTVPPRKPFPYFTTGLLQQSADAVGQVGRRAPQGRIAKDGERGRFDDFYEYGWRIVTRHALDPDLLSDANRELIDRLGMDIVHVTLGAEGEAVIDLDAIYARWFLDTGEKLFIQRPDHVIFGTARDSEGLSALLDDLASQLPVGVAS